MRIPLLVLTLTAASLSAQTWAPVGATWTYTYAVDNIIDPFPPVYSSYALTVSGDTLLDGHLCSRVEGAGLVCHVNAGFTYQSNDSVFLWDATAGAFGLLYRWDAVAGEIWTVPITGLFGPDTLTYTVISTGTIMINSQLRRTLDVQLWDQLGYAFTGGQLIEGIGDLGYLFPWYIALCDGFIMGPLRCYEDGDVGLYMRPGITECDLGTGTGDITPASGFSVSPTLAKASEPITVTYTGSEVQRIDVLDALGRRVASQTPVNRMMELRLSTPGSYTIRSQSAGRLQVRRLMVR